jgi:hypothetical protein
VKLVDWFLKTHETQLKDAALAYERAKRAGVAIPVQEAHRIALQSLAGQQSVLMGTLLESGADVPVGTETTDRHSIIVGATGSGKTRTIIDRLLRRIDLGLAGGFDFELIDPKTETFTEMKKHLAARWCAADAPTREHMRRAIHVIDWTRDRITPTAPFDNSDGTMTDAYAAELHTRVTVEASDVSYTDSLRQLLFMWSFLLIDLRYPANFNFALKFFRDPSYRAHVLTRVKSPDVRQYFSVLAQISAQQTVDAFIRRLWAEQAFPEYRFATSVPPAQLDTLALPKAPRWTLANFGTTNAQPQSLGHTRFRWHIVRRLLAVPRRQTRNPLVEVFEELPQAIAGSPEVTEILMNALRTARSFNVGLMLCAQSLSGTLPRGTVENILLNTHTWSMFQTRPDEADLLYPHVLHDPSSHLSETDRRREFQRLMQSLPRQEFYYLAKGQPALRLRTPTVVDAATATGRSAEELLGIFDRELAPNSMIGVDVAARLIAEWENDVVTQRQIATNTSVTNSSAAPAAPPQQPAGGLQQLRNILGGGSSGKGRP